MPAATNEELAEAALAVLTAEMLYTDKVAMRGNATTEASNLQDAQDDYEAAILSRANPQGAISPATVTEHIIDRDTIVVGP